MIRALVIDNDASGLSSETRVAGLTLLRRTLLTAWRAGAEAAVVVARDDDTARRLRERESGLPIPVTVLPGDDPPTPAPDDRILVLAPQTCPTVEALERLLTAGEPPLAGLADGDDSPGVWLLSGSHCTNSAACAPPDAAIVSLGSNGYRRLRTLDDIARADRAMYHGLTSVSDGYIDRVFNRKISRWFTRRIINLPITPNQVTWFHFSLGLLAAWLFWHGSYATDILGALLFQLSVALDCSDGEVARLKFQFSKFGSWLDVGTDNIVTVAIFAAIAKAAAVRLGVPLALSLGVLSVTGVLMSVLVVFSLAKLQTRTRPGQASSLAVTNRLSDNDQAVAEAPSTLLDRVINEATSRDFSVLVVAFALIGRLEWFAWLSGVGSHLFWMIFGVIQLRMLRTVVPNE